MKGLRLGCPTFLGQKRHNKGYNLYTDRKALVTALPLKSSIPLRTPSFRLDGSRVAVCEKTKSSNASR